MPGELYKRRDAILFGRLLFPNFKAIDRFIIVIFDSQHFELIPESFPTELLFVYIDYKFIELQATLHYKITIQLYNNTGTIPPGAKGYDYTEAIWT